MTTAMPPMDPAQASGAPGMSMAPAAPPGASMNPGMAPQGPSDGIPMGIQPNILKGGSSEPTMPLNQEMKHNWFDGPIPGESLTRELGASPWEKPPKFVELEDAMNFLFDRILQKGPYTQFRVMAEAGVPLVAIAKVMLFGGFGQGLWTMPMANLMAEPTVKMLAAIAMQSGIKNVKIGMPKSAKKKKEEFEMFSMGKMDEPQTNELARLTAGQPVDNPEPKSMSGFLSRDV